MALRSLLWDNLRLYVEECRKYVLSNPRKITDDDWQGHYETEYDSDADKQKAFDLLLLRENVHFLIRGTILDKFKKFGIDVLSLFRVTSILAFRRVTSGRGFVIDVDCCKSKLFVSDKTIDGDVKTIDANPKWNDDPPSLRRRKKDERRRNNGAPTMMTRNSGKSGYVLYEGKRPYVGKRPYESQRPVTPKGEELTFMMTRTSGKKGYGLYEGDDERKPIDSHCTSNENRCAKCLKPECKERTLMLCGGCSKVHYCNVTCQSKHWKTHAHECLDRR